MAPLESHGARKRPWRPKTPEKTVIPGPDRGSRKFVEGTMDPRFRGDDDGGSVNGDLGGGDDDRENGNDDLGGGDDDRGNGERRFREQE